MAGQALVMAHNVDYRRPQDPGLQAERTALAWGRTGWAVLANALLVLRSGWMNQQLPVIFLALALLLASAAVFCHAGWRRRQLLERRCIHPANMAPAAGIVLLAAVVALVTCCAAVVAILANHQLLPIA